MLWCWDLCSGFKIALNYHHKNHPIIGLRVKLKGGEISPKHAKAGAWGAGGGSNIYFYARAAVL
jgi:hypothetical protein